MANPTLRPNAHAIEGYRLLPEMDYIPFKGGMDLVHEIDQLPLGAFSDIQNKRPLRPGFIKRKGCTPLHTTADGSNQVKSLFMYSKGKITDVSFLAQLSDGDTLLATSIPPTVTTGVFGSSIHTSPSPSTMLPASWAVNHDLLFQADGTDYGNVYGGNNQYVSSFIVYKGAAAIPVIPLLGEDYSFKVTDEDTSRVAILDSLSTLTDYDCIFIRTDSPANAFPIVMGAAVNGTASVAQLHYWNGGWAAVSGFTDGTSNGTIAFNASGTMSFASTTDHFPHFMFGQTGYWYRLSLSSGALDSNVEIVSCKYNSFFTSIQNIWDGIPLQAIEAYVYLNSSVSYKFYATTKVDIAALTSSDKYYFNSADPSIGGYVSVGEVPNTTAATTATVKYWNGSTFASVSNLSDGTSSDSKSHAKDGWMTWDHPLDEQPTLFQSSQYFSYWYEVSLNQTLPADMQISIETMPYYDLQDYGNCLSVCAFKSRNSYSFSKLPGYVAISSSAHLTSLNGEDYSIQDVGDGRYNKVVCQKTFYNELLVWQEELGTAGGCLTLIEGTDPASFGKRIISTKHGTFSSKSAVVVEDVPTTSSLSVDTTGKLTSVPGNNAAAFFICRDGIYNCNGKSVNQISQPIQIYFDPKNPKCIRRGYETQHWIDYDSTYQVIRVGLVSGSSATVPNVFLVYDIFSGAWSHDKLAQEISCHCEVETSSGQFPLLQVGGGVDDGTVYLLNSGLTDSGSTIEDFVIQEFDGRGHQLSIEEIVIRSTGSLTITPYVDGVAGTDITITA